MRKVILGTNKPDLRLKLYIVTLLDEAIAHAREEAKKRMLEMGDDE